MRKTICWLIAVAMLVAMAPSVFAAVGDTRYLEDGQYVVTFGDITMQALAEDKSYGRAPGGDVNNLTELDYITVTNVGGGQFTMTDSYGRTIYATSDYSYLFVGTDVESGYLWTLKETAGGYYLTNVDTGRCASYSAYYEAWVLQSGSSLFDGSIVDMVAVEAEGGDTSGDEETQVLLEATATTTNAKEAYEGVVYQLVSPGNGTITLNFYIEDIYPEYQVNIADGWGEWRNTCPKFWDAAPSTATYNVNEGDAIQISIATLDESGEYVPGSVSFDVVFTASSGEAGGEEEEINTVLAEGMNTILIQSGEQLSPQYTFTPETDGVLSLDLVTLVSTYNGQVEDWSESIAELLESGHIGLQVDGYDYTEPVAVTAGVPVIITMTQSRMYAMYFYSWEAGLELTFEGSTEGGEDPDDDGMVLGNNVLEAASGNQSEYTFTAKETGTLYITIRNWSMNSIEYGEKMLTYGWSKILVNGTAMSAMTGTLHVTAGDVVTFVITSDGDHYVSNVFLSMEGYYEEPLGTEFNPVVLTPSDTPTTSIEIPAGGEVWYKLEDFYDYDLRVYGEDAYIISFYYDYSVGWPYPLVSTYHYAENGVATYTVAYQYVMIGNAGTEAATFQIEGYLPEGLNQNPAELQMGEQTIELEFEQYAYYIEWIAPQDGVLTLVFSGDMWRYDAVNVGNPSDYADDGTYFSSRALDEIPVDTVVIEVKAGDLVRINVGCSNAEYDIPAGTVTINASFEAAEAEVVLGDVNGDGTINYLDAMMVAQFYVGDIDESGLNVAAGDVNGDGIVNYLDAMMIAQYYVGDIDSFTP